MALPERLDRRMRLGPFPSSRDALKFITYAAAGALLSPFASPWVWTPVVLVGFAVSVWRPEGQALDERAVAFLSWKWRTVGSGRSPRSLTPPPLTRRGLLRVAPQRHVAIVRTGGTPVAYLPPDELARRFDLYRDLLRSLEGGFVSLATTAPIRSQSVRPTSVLGSDAEAVAQSGYSELVQLLCRRRHLRRVYLVLGTTEGGPDAIGRLEGRVATLLDTLTHMGLRPIRLRDQSLTEAARRFGWPVDLGAS